MAAALLAFLGAWIATPEPVYWYMAVLPASYAGETYMRKWKDNATPPPPLQPQPQPRD